EREKAFERKFGMEEEAEFRIAVRAAKIFGHWAAGHLKLEPAEADEYVEHIGNLAVKPGLDSIIEKVNKDLQEKGVTFTRHRLEKEMNDSENKARQENRREAS